MQPILQPHVEVLLDGLRDGLMIHGGGRIVYANASMARILGFTHAAELLDRCVLELCPEDEYPAAIARLQAIAFGGSAHARAVHRLQRVDGRVVAVELSAYPLRTALGLLVLEIVRAKED